MQSRLQQLEPHSALSSQKLTPFKESGISFRFEGLAVVDVAIKVEMIVKRSVG